MRAFLLCWLVGASACVGFKDASSSDSGGSSDDTDRDDTDRDDTDRDDDDCPTWYDDDDGDGFGDDTSGRESCDPPEDRVANGEDCDDDDAAVNPDAPEVCDGVDNDCDGDKDDEDDDVDLSTGTTWALDHDEDGTSGDTYTTVACEAPDGATSVSRARDCDDDDPAINPDAEEICYNGIDEDCDEEADGCGLEEGSTDSAVATILGEDYSFVGYALAIGDINGSGGAELIVPSNVAERVYAWSAPFSGEMTPDDAIIDMGALSSTGAVVYAYAVTATDDLDGDGVNDWAVAAPGASSMGDTVEIYGGDPRAPSDVLFSLDRDGSAARGCGTALAGGAGDLTDDGDPDLVIGCASDTHGGFLVTDIDDSIDLGGISTSASGRSGSSVAAGDVNGDGVGEVFFGAWGEDKFGWYYGPVDEDSHTNGSVSGPDAFGTLISYLGDVTGDGYGDFLAGDAYATTYLYPGDAAYFGSSYDNLSLMGTSAAGGDFDGDGVQDLAVGVPSANDYDGEVRFAFGPVESAPDWEIISGERTLAFGMSLAAGDLNGDGVHDLAVGAPYNSPEGEGVLFVFLGASF